MSIPQYNPGPADWRHLDRGAAAALWLELREWTEWLRRRYDLGSAIKSCWFKHDPMVEELTAAMFAHREVYQAVKTPYHGGMAAWHYQVLWPLVGRLSKMGFSECRGGVCGFEPDAPAVADDFAEFIANEVDSRPEAAPLIEEFLDAVEDAATTASALTVDQVLEMIDTDRAIPEDPSDELTAVDIGGTRWEFDAGTETYRPVE
ncbi:hypothetical protein [Rhodococcus qingshengii]|uniref:hypothetical protein n=1 Tax=Rhodococcus qingshengii TaxID=334542 RepID=UPI00237D19B8|nr:hypothetical protein [Rhodococcus qingshengii]WCT06221.1 hypothetical protein PI247_31940 [Rhodococcus qingshengii]